HALTKVKFSAKVQPNQALYLSELSLHNLGSEGSFAYTTGDSKVGAWDKTVDENVGFAIALSDETKSPIVSTDAINVTATDGATLVIPQERDKVDVSDPAPGLFTGNTVNSYIKMVYSLQNTTIGDWIVGKGSEVKDQVTAYIPVDVAFNMNQVVNYIINFGTGNGGYDDGGDPIIDQKEMIQFDTKFDDWDAETDVDPTPTPPAPPTSNIPDAVLAEYLVGAGYVEKDKDGINYVATSEGLALKMLMLTTDPVDGDPKLAGVKNVAGLDLFTGLVGIALSGFTIESLDISVPNSVGNLYLMDSPGLKSVTVTGGVEFLSINIGDFFLELTSIARVDNKPIKLLVGDYAKLAPTFDFFSVKNMVELSFKSDEEVATLDLTGCASLATLDCSNIKMSSLILYGCTNLTTLDCSNNKLTVLDLSENTALNNLACCYNQLDALDINTIANLSELACGGQKDAGGTGKEMILTLTAAQMTTWTSKWGQDQTANKDVTPYVPTK
ncbi:MAG: hypothetical protein ACRCZY_12575, partial [Phocaeicola sp.]